MGFSRKTCFPAPAARLAALQSGEVDWAEVIPPDSIEQVKAAGYNVLLKTYPHTIYYGFNTYRAPFNDVRVRQAVAYGIDRAGNWRPCFGEGWS